MGAIASNLLALPATAAFIAVFQLSWMWILTFTAVFIGIEWLFLKMGIYSHNWWRIEYTAIGLPFYFAVAKVWVRWIHEPLSGIRSCLILFLITGALMGTLQVLPIIFYSSRSYHVGWFDNPSRETTACASVIYLLISLIYVGIVKLRTKSLPWLKYVLTLLLIYFTFTFLIKAGIMQSNVWWDRVYYMLVHTVVLWLAHSLNNRLLRGSMRRQET
ncbi:MAG: hypothetical protein K0S39_1228 [Paenibacillus sp.]|jgi:hypothetical protein|nr:hypothetical protein [Paenibacillus sp.]